MSFPAPSAEPRREYPTVSGHRPVVGVSTKMYFSHARTTAFVSSVLALLREAPGAAALLRDRVDAFVAPDFVSIPATRAAVIVEAEAGAGAGAGAGARLVVGAQDCAAADEGPYTGEVSPAVLRELGCGLAEVGHAERRRLFGESDDLVRRKAAAAARNGLVPLVCVGEEVVSPGVRAAAEEVLGQVKAVLDGLDGEADVILAYEPVWAIGAPEPASAEHVRGVARLVRESEAVRGRPGRTRIVYGGAAGPGLWGRLGGEVDGLFLGRFAHQPEQFVKMLYEVAGMDFEAE
ncbi:Triosephosphate isomerase-like protein [Thermothelomyces thermophilus ATCC 42464]|uniref:Triosephosphate isomerase n=1 Tax=Thermothelomyces thermophilus (strain ATCC 42464 / BCRC 31852 / DSM 1799) TaxID=573729 RepID=G2Q226_THET4|nr:Triosephosphate isomerase-like protein [Thermothelomyces thermophilus ATCC 42464]AEO55059.1 Triosephosphate isomerase-like protein [Thermothelomyces thermophilus ATCC 42464]